MSITPNSLAQINAVGVQNVQLKAGASVLNRKIVIVGTYDNSKTIVDDTLAQIFSPEDAASKYGFGSMLHRLAIWADKGAKGVETWVVPQAEAGGAVAASGDITFVASGIQAGTMYLYISGELVNFTVADADTAADIATKCVAAINANDDINVTAAVNGGVPEQVDVTSKTLGTYGNDVSISFNEINGQEFPTGLTSATVTPMASGAGLPDIQDALDGLGVGDAQNENYFTDFIFGYGQDATTLNLISAYNGTGNIFEGNYAKEVMRPFRTLTGDVVAGSSGLSALIALGDGRKLDRTSGIIAVPDSPNHPSEIAAQAMGIQTRLNNTLAEENAGGQVLADVIPGAKDQRWSDDYDNRDLAVNAGISPTKIVSGAVTIQNLVTFYHPDNVPSGNNGYRNQRNISLLQNISNSVRENFDQEKWKGISIVSDVTRVTNINSAQKARDIDSVINDFVVLAESWENNAWIFAASHTIENLQVVIRSLTNGFDNIIPLVLSGEGDIINTLIQFDTSIAVFL